ncbi:MAG TPA: hypothetical protein VFJ96_09020 [Gemmatimonadaceae bacterium]|nr:hypothetical protein [Gemmatimonadaceae bacterium]
MRQLAFIVAAAASLAVAAPLHAQRADTTRNKVPDNQRPPAGMCRIWLNDVPAGQQPAPTDCATAIRHRPPNGRVVFGEPVQTPLVERHAAPQMDRTVMPPVRRDTQPTDERHPRVDSVRPPTRSVTPRQPPRRVRRDSSERGPWTME